QSALGNQADAMYREDGTLGFVAALLSSRTFEDFNSTMELIQRIGEQNASTVSQLKVTEQATQVQQQRLVNAQTDAATQQAVMAANEAAVHARLADQQKLLASLSADIKTILAQQAAAAAAAAAARARALAGRHTPGGGFDPGGNPPTSSKGAAAVWWAEKALGKPYVWAATGPNSFDCSGLMKWAYGHVGIDLPHYSGAQINVGARVSKSNLEPGDLVFFGSPIHHVGMYIGGGDFIEAPYTGVDVRISSLADRGDYAGASRP
ncbi:MAG TPA: NlpC/P60 family protein, partial [Coriobacteriia bacterium]